MAFARKFAHLLCCLPFCRDSSKSHRASTPIVSASLTEPAINANGATAPHELEEDANSRDSLPAIATLSSSRSASVVSSSDDLPSTPSSRSPSTDAEDDLDGRPSGVAVPSECQHDTKQVEKEGILRVKHVNEEVEAKERDSSIEHEESQVDTNPAPGFKRHNSKSGMSFKFKHNSSATVQLERIVLLDNHIIGYVTVENLDYHKEVFVRWTSDGWRNLTNTACKYHSSNAFGRRDTFAFRISVAGPIELCVFYVVRGHTYCDNNNGKNYSTLSNIQ